MNVAEIRTDLHEKIEHADSNQLKEIYGLLINYFNGQDSIEEWDTLTDSQKEAINEGLAQAEAGLGEPAEEFIKRLRNKYGLND
jgi:hypothetical protein